VGKGKIVAVTSGIRGGVGKSLLSLLITYLACKTLRRLKEKNYISFCDRVLLIDLMGGVTRFITIGMSEEDKSKLESPPNLREFLQGNRRSFRRIRVNSEEFYLIPWDSNPIELTENSASRFIELMSLLKKVFGLIIVDFPAFNSNPFYYILENTDIQVHVYTHEKVAVEQIYSSLARVRNNNTIVVLNKDVEKYYEWNPVDFLKEAYLLNDSDLIKVNLSPYLSLISLRGLEALKFLERAKIFSKGDRELKRVGKQVGDLVSTIIDLAISG